MTRFPLPVPAKTPPPNRTLATWQLPFLLLIFAVCLGADIRLLHGADQVGSPAVPKSASQARIKGEPEVRYWLEDNPTVPAAARARLSACADAFSDINYAVESGSFDFSKFDIPKYDASCLNRLTPQLLSQHASIVKVLGVVRITPNTADYPGAVVCTATQLNRKFVLTALHCLRNPYASDNPKLHVNQLVFSRMDAPAVMTPVIAAHFFNDSYAADYLADRTKDQRFDYAILELAHERPLPEGTTLVARPLFGDQLRYITPGFNWILAYRGATPNIDTMRRVGSNWAEYIRFGDTEVCKVHRIEDPTCLVHSCPSVGGSSGAPLFVSTLSQSELRLVGVHSGSFLRESCLDRRQRVADSIRLAYPNVAIKTEESWIAKFSQPK